MEAPAEPHLGWPRPVLSGSYHHRLGVPCPPRPRRGVPGPQVARRVGRPHAKASLRLWAGWQGQRAGPGGGLVGGPGSSPSPPELPCAAATEEGDL